MNCNDTSCTPSQCNTEPTTAAAVTELPTVAPRVDAWSDDQGDRICLDLPGVPRESVELHLDGTVLMDLPHGGFITVIQSAVARARVVARTEGNPPVRIIRYDNGRLVAEDPATGWSTELYAFGDDNKAAFERLLSDQAQE